MFTFSDDIKIELSDVMYGSKVLEYVEADVPSSVSVFYPHTIRKTLLYLHCTGYVPLSALCDKLSGSSRRMIFSRHNYIVNEFAAAIFRFLYIGQSSYSCYSRVRYESDLKRYHIMSFFKINVTM